MKIVVFDTIKMFKNLVKIMRLILNLTFLSAGLGITTTPKQYRRLAKLKPLMPLSYMKNVMSNPRIKKMFLFVI